MHSLITIPLDVFKNIQKQSVSSASLVDKEQGLGVTRDHRAPEEFLGAQAEAEKLGIAWHDSTSGDAC